MSASRLILLLIVLDLLSSRVSAQSGQDTAGKIRLYLSCETCDFDFVRTEIPYVDYVRDPANADVHCYVVHESASNAGSRYTFVFLGRNTFEGLTDTLKVLQQESSTPSDFRRETSHAIQLGLARFVSHSPQASLLSVSYKQADTTASPLSDPWNNWVFSTDINAYVFGEQSHDTQNYWGSVNANRTTPDWKIKLGISENYYENSYKDLGLNSISRSSSFDALVVRSLGEHWSAGPSVTVGTSTYRNRRLDLEALGAVEFDVFPYSESTSRQLRLLYKLGAAEFQYFDQTIFDRTEELVGTQILSASLVFQQQWGSIEFTVAGSQYLHDLSKTELNIFANMQWRVVEGLSFRLVGNYASIHDQIFLPKTGLTSDEILLQREQLATNFSYYTSIGLTYTFGSIYNDVVNPRFGN